MKDLLFVILMYVLSLFHICNWEDCTHNFEYKSENNFVSAYGFKDNSDLYLIELTHFIYPSWKYEECEEYVFTGVE